VTQEVLTLARLRATTPDEASALWMVRGAESVTDAVLFEEWLADSDANTAAWEKAQRIWDSFENAGDDEMLQAMRTSALAMRPPRQRLNWGWMAAGIACALMVGGLFVEVLTHQPYAPGPAGAYSSAQPVQSAVPAFITGKDQQLQADLPDGTKLTLDTDSALDVAFDGRHRDVRLLRGQVFFDVVHDPSRPFTVTVRGIIATAVGTRFGASLAGDSSAITLVEGRVAITKVGGPAAAAIEIHAGERYTTSTSGADTVTQIDPESALSWQKGYIEFRNDTIAAAAAELNRHSQIQILIRDPTVAALRVSGRFKSGDVERFCHAVELVQAVRAVRRSPTTIELVATSR
jgi:transmembrane sensor